MMAVHSDAYWDGLMERPKQRRVDLPFNRVKRLMSLAAATINGEQADYELPKTNCNVCLHIPQGLGRLPQRKAQCTDRRRGEPHTGLG